MSTLPKDTSLTTAFACSDVVLLRAAVREAHPGSQPATDEDADYLRAAAKDPLLREALSISSPSLIRTLDDVCAGRIASPKRIRRAVRAVSRYRLRMSSRATPFGLMAGVSTAHFGPHPRVRWGEAHVKCARVDLEWFGGVLSALESDEAVLRKLRVVVNNLCFVRGDRVINPYVPQAGKGETLTREVSVRLTSAVREIWDRARFPLGCTDLVDALADAFPAAGGDLIMASVARLVRAGVLVTELRAPLDDTDPLETLLSRLDGSDGAFTARTGEVLAELREVRRELAAYARTPLGEPGPVLDRVTDRMRRVQPADTPVQVDLRLDVDVQLPDIVRGEVEQAAEALWVLSSGHPGPGFLTEFHEDFIERYGVGRAVPLRDAVDPDIGLAAPAGYRFPRSPRTLRGKQVADSEHDDLLLSLAQGASIAGEREIVLDDSVLGEIRAEAGTPPPSMDMLAHLISDSTSALAAGDFRLVVVGTQTLAGAFAGRFAPLLGRDGDRIGEMVRGLPTSAPQATRARLFFPPHRPRAGNVARVPVWADQRIVLGSFADTGRPDTLGLRDLAVVATPRRLAVVSLRTGREVVPTVPSTMAVDRQAPNAGRLLHEIVRSGEPAWPGWRWGAAESLPYLPRVRVGRTVLSSARWKPDAALRDPAAGPGEWRRSLKEWRVRWGVPDRVQLVENDQRISLDLTSTGHQDLLRNGLSRGRPVQLVELPAGGKCGTGWLSASGGTARGRTNELAFSLVRREDTAARGAPHGENGPLSPPVTGAARAVHLSGRAVFPPGSSWLYAKLYCSSERQDEIIARALADLLAKLPDLQRWFYIRYQDPDAHLRLRFHGDPAELAGGVLPLLGDWASGLSASGMAGRLVLDTYDPEWERYGGPEAMSCAEEFFRADSAACVGQLRLEPSLPPVMSRRVLAAANCADLAVRLLGDREAAGALFDCAGTSGGHEARALLHGEAKGLIDPAGGWERLRALPSGPELAAVWDERAEALNAYAQRLRDLNGALPRSVLPSLLHMHHNRLCGIDRANEAAVTALAAAAVDARQRRAGRPR
ncbi:lantibiotic dehydratase [Streptomyces sp. TS71-3]|uniref:lantibiotic dehydratase n=1 Tax=Streptomyces sp. TS71-3 TaxID=2733862 RepID=UPI001BB44AAC|nr:lantibiotic dehydratase [Streptomyces sp. TS71-3]